MKSLLWVALVLFAYSLPLVAEGPSLPRNRRYLQLCKKAGELDAEAYQAEESGDFARAISLYKKEERLGRLSCGEDPMYDTKKWAQIKIATLQCRQKGESGRSHPHLQTLMDTVCKAIQSRDPVKLEALAACYAQISEGNQFRFETPSTMVRALLSGISRGPKAVRIAPTPLSLRESDAAFGCGSIVLQFQKSGKSGRWEWTGFSLDTPEVYRLNHDIR